MAAKGSPNFYLIFSDKNSCQCCIYVPYSLEDKRNFRSAFGYKRVKTMYNFSIVS
jgi:hypothetical protein